MYHGGDKVTAESSFKTICSYLPYDIREAVMKTDAAVIGRLTEIRLYCGRGAVLFERDKWRYLEKNGKLSGTFSSSAVKVGPEHMKHIVSSVSRFSFHSHEPELTDGWFVLENGVRAGICGAFSKSGKGIVRDVSSVNFRIAREVKGISTAIADKCYGSNILICGAVNSGKTTLLRDLCRVYGNITKCTLVDERCEISALKNGIPAFDVGMFTDVITGRNRRDSIIGALRTMSPYYIFCDEVADEGDTEAIIAGIGCGTRFAATVHAESCSELIKRKAVSPLIANGAFDTAVFLEKTGIREMRKL